MIRRLNYSAYLVLLEPKVMLWETDTSGCRILGKYTALGSDETADKLASGDTNDIVLGGAGEMSAGSVCKGAARHRDLWWSILRRGCSRWRKASRIPQGRRQSE